MARKLRDAADQAGVAIWTNIGWAPRRRPRRFTIQVEVAAVLASMWGRDLRDRLERDATALAPAPPAGRVLTEADAASLPGSVGRYLRFMGVIGRPGVTSFRAHLHGSFRLRPSQSFMAAEVWQYSTVNPIARLFWMRIDLAAGLLPLVGRDSYVGGRGRLLGKLLDLVVVADGEGEPFDVGELTTWLNDAVIMAPSMLLAAGASFVEVDDNSFVVNVSDAGRTVSARVLLDGRGAPVDFHTEDRYADLPGGPIRTPWSTPIEGWQLVDGRHRPIRGSAVWHLPDGDYTYGILDFASHSIEDNPAVSVTHPPLGRLQEGFDSLCGAAAMVIMLVGSPLVRNRYNRWGATESECRAGMAGDELVPDARLVSTRAITIDAPPEAVWPWLVQIGQGRGGLYSYDALENLVGLDIHSANEILPAHQNLAPGDLVRLGKPGSPCFTVESVTPGRSLVLISADPVTQKPVPTPMTGGTWATWQWELLPVRDRTATRLISRQRNTHPDRERLLWRLVEPIGFVMERRMMLGIKQRVERRWPHIPS